MLNCFVFENLLLISNSRYSIHIWHIKLNCQRCYMVISTIVIFAMMIILIKINKFFIPALLFLFQEQADHRIFAHDQYMNLSCSNACLEDEPNRAVNRRKSNGCWKGMGCLKKLKQNNANFYMKWCHSGSEEDNPMHRPFGRWSRCGGLRVMIWSLNDLIRAWME